MTPKVRRSVPPLLNNRFFVPSSKAQFFSVIVFGSSLNSSERCFTRNIPRRKRSLNRWSKCSFNHVNYSSVCIASCAFPTGNIVGRLRTKASSLAATSSTGRVSFSIFTGIINLLIGPRCCLTGSVDLNFIRMPASIFANNEFILFSETDANLFSLAGKISVWVYDESECRDKFL